MYTKVELLRDESLGVAYYRNTRTGATGWKLSEVYSKPRGGA